MMMNGICASPLVCSSKLMMLLLPSIHFCTIMLHAKSAFRVRRSFEHQNLLFVVCKFTVHVYHRTSSPIIEEMYLKSFSMCCVCVIAIMSLHILRQWLEDCRMVIRWESLLAFKFEKKNSDALKINN